MNFPFETPMSLAQEVKKITIVGTAMKDLPLVPATAHDNSNRNLHQAVINSSY